MRTKLAPCDRTFFAEVDQNVWTLLPVSRAVLTRVDWQVSALRGHVFLRAGDAIHLVTAAQAGFTEIWSNDRHLLAAAPAFGLQGRTVTT